MLRHRITIDNFMELDAHQLTFALRNMQQELNGTIDLLKSEPDAVQDEDVLDELSNLLTLRKALLGRATELAEEADTASAVVVNHRGELALRTFEKNATSLLVN